MAKIRWSPWFGLARGSIDGAAVSSIKRPSSPLVFGKNQQSDTLYMPRYNRRQPKGKQTEVRERYCACARTYVGFTDSQKEYLRLQALNYSRAHDYDPPLTAYTYFLKICLHAETPQEQIATITIDWLTVSFDNMFWMDLEKTPTTGMYSLQCTGEYSVWAYPVEDPICPQYESGSEKWVHAWCNYRRLDDPEFAGVRLHINNTDNPIVFSSHGSSTFYLPVELEKIGFSWPWWYVDRGNGICTYTLYEVMI